jgi:carbon storage regulator
MLVLSRKVGEKIVVGDNVVITINRVAGNRVTIGIEAPGEVRIVRGELEPIVNAFQEADDLPRASRRPGASAANVEAKHIALKHV